MNYRVRSNSYAIVNEIGEANRGYIKAALSYDGNLAFAVHVPQKRKAIIGGANSPQFAMSIRKFTEKLAGSELLGWRSL